MEMGKKKVGMDIFILLDRTGSMASKWEESVSSVNSYVKEIAKDKAKDVVTLAVFDSQSYDVLRDAVSINDWEDMGKEEVLPRGLTPLLDSLMKIIVTAEEKGNKKTTLVVMTDGMENASSENTLESVKAAIERVKQKDWQINFLGADFDAFGQAGLLGIPVGVTMNFMQGCAGQAMSSTARTHSAYRGGATGQSLCYSDDDRANSGEDSVQPN